MKPGPRLSFVLALLLVAFVPSCAPRAVLMPVKDLTAGQLKEMIDGGSGLVLVDTRTEYEYGQGRLPGSISIPPYRFKELGTLLPSDKDAEIVFDCRGRG